MRTKRKMNVRGSHFNNLGSGEGWCEASGLQHLRCLGYADDLSRHIRHKGWFADAHQDETYRGIVYLLPCRNAYERHYLVGYADPMNDGCAYLETYVELLGEAEEHTDHPGDYAHRGAAHQANDIAERCADKAREYDEHWQENSWLTEKAGEVRDTAVELGQARALMREYLRNRRRMPLAAAHAVGRVRELSVDLAGSAMEFAKADSEAIDKFYTDPLDHDSAADHDPDLCRRARVLAELMDIE